MRAVTLDQLIALNDEMSALVRAGVPIDRGLVAAGHDLRGRAGRMAGRLGERLERGESLPEALEAEGEAIPGFYRAVVEAGLRSGRLSKALEGLADYARSFAETRRAIGLALLYPLMVLLLAYGLFVMFVLFVAPRVVGAFAAFRLPGLWALAPFRWFEEHLAIWAPIPPVVLALLVIAWLRSGRASTLRPGRLGGVLRLVPGMGSILDLAQTADFADLLALMVDHDVPLGRGIGLAAEATGSPRLRVAASETLARIERGESASEAGAGLPPMLGWTIATAGAGGPLAPALRQAAASYRGRAERKAETLRAVLPAVLVGTVGLVAVALYATVVFGPLITFWRELAMPTSD